MRLDIVQGPDIKPGAAAPNYHQTVGTCCLTKCPCERDKQAASAAVFFKSTSIFRAIVGRDVLVSLKLLVKPA